MLAAVAGDVAADEICLHKSNASGARVRPGHSGLFLSYSKLCSERWSFGHHAAAEHDQTADVAQALEGERGHIASAHHRRLVESQYLDASAFREGGASLVRTESANISYETAVAARRHQHKRKGQSHHQGCSDGGKSSLEPTPINQHTVK